MYTATGEIWFTASAWVVVTDGGVNRVVSQGTK